MRFSQRSATQDPTARADLYAATIDMCAWAESHGALAAILSQHHGSEDGYLPSPVPLAAAIAARTSTLPITVAALLLALYEPVKLAEDLAVVDLISRGRVSYVIGIGYRDEEFDMFGVDRRGRGHLVEERIGLLQRLWSGEEIDLDGRVDPRDATALHARWPDARLRRWHRGGGSAGGPSRPHVHGRVARHHARRGLPGRRWRWRPRLLLRTGGGAEHRVRRRRPRAGLGRDRRVHAPRRVSYSGWNAHREGTVSISRAPTVAALAAEKGAYQIITPAEARELIGQGNALGLQPLVGGIPRDIAWPYLENAAAVS